MGNNNKFPGGQNTSMIYAQNSFPHICWLTYWCLTCEHFYFHQHLISVGKTGPVPASGATKKEESRSLPSGSLYSSIHSQTNLKIYFHFNFATIPALHTKNSKTAYYTKAGSKKGSNTQGGAHLSKHRGLVPLQTQRKELHTRRWEVRDQSPAPSSTTEGPWGQTTSAFVPVSLTKIQRA